MSPEVLAGQDLRRADLSGRDLRGADLKNGRLLLADLSGADLSGADLTGADLRGACLAGATLHDVVLGDSTRLEGCVLADTGFSAEGTVARGTVDAWRRARRAIVAVLDNLDSADPDDALDALDAADLALGGWSWAWSHLGQALARAANDDAALDVLITAVALDSQPATRKALADVLMRRDDLESAALSYRRLASQNPDNAMYAASLGYLAGRLGKLDEAREALDHAIALGKTDRNTWSALGMVAFGQDDFDRARQAFVHAASTDRAAHVANLVRFHLADDDPVAAGRASERLPVGEYRELRAQVGAALGGPSAGLEEIMRQRLAARQPEPTPLPVPYAMIDRLRREHPELAPFPADVRFASPYAVGLLFPTPHNVRIAWFDGHSLQLSQERLPELPTGDDAQAMLDLVAAQPPLADPAVPPLFDERTAGEEVLHLFPRPPGLLARRLEGLDARLQDQYGLAASAWSGPHAIVDALVPDTAGRRPDDTPVAWIPPTARRRGPARWQLAQVVAWIGLDRRRFLADGQLVASPQLGEILDHASPTERRELLGMAGVVWLRWFSGLARLWPERRGRFYSRFVDVLNAVETGLGEG